MMARVFLLAAALLGLLAGPAASQGRETVAWDQVGSWHIRVDRTMDDSCFAQKIYKDGTSLRLGIDARRQAVYFVISNDAWDLLEVDKVYPVYVVFDDRKSHEVSLSTFSLGKNVALGNGGISADFIKDFRKSSTLRVVHRGLSIVHLQLRDANAAIDRTADCQQAMLAEGTSATGASPGKREFSF